MKNLFVLLMMVTAPWPALAQTPASQPQPSPEKAFVTQYCLDCHNDKRKSAGLALDAADVDKPTANPVAWEKVIRRLRLGGMPPPSAAAKPDRGAVSAFVASLERGLDAADTANWNADAAVALTDQELASRLAAFLWSSWPDDELLDAASKGRLKNPAVLAEQAARMLKDRRSDALLSDFFGQWLSLGNLAKVKTDPSILPDFDDDLREAMRRETELFLESQVRENHGVLDLLTANYTFVNERLARHYGIPNITGAAFQRSPIVDPARGGLLGQGSILTITSFANRTSPVVRGKWVLENLLGVAPPPPPANVPPLSAKTESTLRDRMEQHRKNAVCASCHYLMDPIGFAFENFNAVGQWRTTDAGLPIDSTGQLPDGTPFRDPAEFKTTLVNDRRDAIVTNIAEKLLGYAIARRVEYFDEPAARAIVRDASPTGYTWSSMILAVVKSTPFQMKRRERAGD